MEALTDKTILAYDYSSRYNTIPFYYNTIDHKYVRGLTKNILRDFEYSIHTIKQNDTLDSLALYYYGRPDLYWILADVNGIKDPFINLYNTYRTLIIPAYKDIRFE